MGRVSPIQDDSMDILLQAAVVHSILENDSPRQEDRFEPGGGTFGGAGASGSWTEPQQERETVHETHESHESHDSPSSDSSSDSSD
jgi:hypothetical protein